jgi:iron complex outermembrane receptor protein
MLLLLWASLDTAAAQNGALEGRVQDASTGEGLPTANVTLPDTDRGIATLTDGTFMLTDLPPGTYVVNASYIGYAVASESVTIEAGQTARITLELEPSTLVTEGLVVTALRTRTATKTNTPLRLIPQGVQVIPQRVLQDQQVETLDAALRNVSSVARSSSDYGFSDVFHLRGFQARELSNYRRNGVEYYHYLDPMTANVDRVEVLKGPSSVLYGTLQPGGVVNFITKQPLAESAYRAELRGGSFGYLSPRIDATGALAGGGALRYRLNAAYERADSFRDIVGRSDALVAPVVTWVPSDRTEWTLEGEYRAVEQVTDPGLIAPGNSFDALDALEDGTFLGEEDARLDWRSARVESRIDHRLGSRLRVRNVLSVSDYDRDPGLVVLNGLAEDARSVRRRYEARSYDHRSLYGEVDLITNFQTGPVRHEVLAGADVRRTSTAYQRVRADLGTVDFARPVQTGLPDLRGVSFTNDTESVETLYGLFAQTQMTVGRRLTLLAGFRSSWIEEETTNLLTPDADPSTNDHQAFSPRIGGVYELTPWLSTYASFSESFVPTTNTDRDGNPFDPIRGQQYEAGLKLEAFGGALVGTLAAYQITKDNEVSWVNDPDFGWYTVQGSEQRSNGVELDLIGSPARGLDLMASYAYTDARILEDPNYERGRVLSGAPRHSGSVWSTVRVTDRLSLGGGLFFAGEMASWLSSDVRMPGYVTVDATASYRFRQGLAVRVNAQNLTDARYYVGAYATDTSPSISTYLGAARSVQISLVVQR